MFWKCRTLVLSRQTWRDTFSFCWMYLIRAIHFSSIRTLTQRKQQVLFNMEWNRTMRPSTLVYSSLTRLDPTNYVEQQVLTCNEMEQRALALWSVWPSYSSLARLDPTKYIEQPGLICRRNIITTPTCSPEAFDQCFDIRFYCYQLIAQQYQNSILGVL